VYSSGSLPRGPSAKLYQASVYIAAVGVICEIVDGWCGSIVVKASLS
jgi:hypothetical protein